MTAHPIHTPSVARWSDKLKALPVLSIRQPYAWLIVNGIKDVENRSRPIRYRGPILIHAGLSTHELSDDNIRHLSRIAHRKIPIDSLMFGGIVGVAEIVDCVEKSDSPWKMEAHWAWVMANPRVLPFKACRGALGLFRVADQLQ